MNYDLLKLTFGVIASIGLYSVLYRENKFYRFWEHIFLGLAAGYAVVALWSETLKSSWYDKMVGSTPEGAGGANMPGYWAWALLLPIGLMGYMVFSKKHNWISRVPIGIILGLWAGQQPLAWWNRYGAQIASSLKPIFPTTTAMFKPGTVGLDPAEVTRINSQVYVSTAITNLIFVFTILAVLSYFLFSFDFKSRGMKMMTTSGRWLLMIGFGAIFGSTVMMRFTLLIDRMYFIWIEWLKHGIFQMPG